MPRLQLAHGCHLDWGEGRTLTMGVLNATPDSFSDGGLYAEGNAAIAHACHLLDDGADLLDVGGESSRPGAAPVPLGEEAGRVLPVVRGVLAQRPEALISVDTRKPDLARQAVEAGAHLINDISGGREPGMLEAVADTGAALCVMHMRGTPETMQKDPRYENVVEDVAAFFEARLAALRSHGIAPDRVVLDPGIGFGKTVEHNLKLIAACGSYAERFGCPVLLGVSRKGMLGKLTGISEPDRRDRATHAAHAVGVALGASIVRVHDVLGAVETLRVVDAILSARGDSTA